MKCCGLHKSLCGAVIQKIVACSQSYLAGLSYVNSIWHGVILNLTLDFTLFTQDSRLKGQKNVEHSLSVYITLCCGVSAEGVGRKTQIPITNPNLLSAMKTSSQVFSVKMFMSPHYSYSVTEDDARR